MSTEKQNKKKALKLSHNDVMSLWTKVKAGKVTGWAGGKALEYLILRQFHLENAVVQYPYDIRTGTTVIEQIDGAVHVEGLSALIEAKDYSKKLNVEPIAKLRNQLLRRPSAAVGVIFSKKGFTDPAWTLAQYLAPQTILLWDGGEIELALQKKKMVEGLKLKFRYAVERGLPDFNLKASGAI